ncbi:transcriptional regulator [Burkholderia pseudomallei]|nr:transcriptional regulator [Burkholderia pseudomallei]OMV64293.1 transcriptional regulator [Burkholderia pseudomallei]OMV76055.1 transcriptional regulator [Burkholderia pseudomallei]OMV90897.1 transcriptional regulator [Burkholderia pseudomallei]OND86443.1 transcriptional regulator [Burkholderia pseudomallei]
MPIAIRLESRDVTKASRGCAHEGFFCVRRRAGRFRRGRARTHGRTDARSLDAPGVLGALGMLGPTGAAGAIGAARRRF